MTEKYTFDIYENKLAQEADEYRIKLLAIHEKRPQPLKSLAKEIALHFNTLMTFLGGEEVSTRSLLKIRAFVKLHEHLLNN